MQSTSQLEHFYTKKKIITFLTQLLQKEAQNEVPSCR